MSGSDDLERHIEAWEHERSQRSETGHAPPGCARRATGFERKLLSARAAREAVLAQRAQATEFDAATDAEEPAAGPKPVPEVSRPQVATMAALRGLRPDTLPEFDPQDPNVGPAEGAPTTPVATIAKFSFGLVAGLVICGVLLAAASYVQREVSGAVALSDAVPAVMTEAAAPRTPEVPEGAGWLSTEPAEPGAHTVARAAIHPLTSPLRLSDVPRQISLAPDARSPLAGSAMPPLQGSVLSVQDLPLRWEEGPRTAWALPSSAAMAPELAPATAERRPVIDMSARAPEYGRLDLALAQPSSEPVPAGFDLSLDGDGGTAAAGRLMMTAALPMTAGPDAVPAALGPNARVDLGSVRIRAPGVPAAPKEVAGLGGPAQIFSMPGRPAISRLVHTNEDPVPQLDRKPALSGQPVLQTTLAGSLIAVPPSASPVDLPRTDRRPDFSNTTAVLAALPTDTRFDTVTAQPATTPTESMRAIVTVSSRGAEDIERLDRLGLDIAQVQVTPFTVPRTRIHYFHPADAERAEDVAARLSGEAINMTGIVPSPPAGMLEIQLSD